MVDLLRFIILCIWGGINFDEIIYIDIDMFYV